jgi:hypothetical protein
MLGHDYFFLILNRFRDQRLVRPSNTGSHYFKSYPIYFPPWQPINSSVFSKN